MARILHGRDLAKKRFEGCNSQIAATSGKVSPFQDLGARWMSKDAVINGSSLLNDSIAQDAVVKLIYDTEVQTSQICGTPTGDDATLFCSAKSPKAVEP